MSSSGRIVVGINGSPRNTAALHAAARLAIKLHVPLVLVCAWMPHGGEAVARRSPCPPLDEAFRNHARETVRTAIASLPTELDLHSDVHRGYPGPALVQAACHPDDLLVVGAGRRNPIARSLFATVTPYCLRHASCPVLIVPEPLLLKHLRHPTRSRTADQSRTRPRRGHFGRVD